MEFDIILLFGGNTMNDNQLMELIKNKNYEEALKLLFEAIESDPKEVTHYINVGTILFDTGKLEEAERFFQKAITVNPEHGGAYYGLANIYYNAERFDEAVKLYQKAVANELQDADTYYMLGMSFVNLGDMNSALPYLMRAHELNNMDTEIAFQYGLVMCQLSMYRDAVNMLQRVMDQDANHADALYNLTLAQYMIDEDADNAIEGFKSVLKVSPDHMLAGHAVKQFELLKEE